MLQGIESRNIPLVEGELIEAGDPAEHSEKRQLDKNISLKDVRVKILIFYAARALSAEFANGLNYFGLDSRDDFNKWKQDSWEHFLADPLAEKYTCTDDTSFYIPLAYLVTLMKKCDSLYRQRDPSISADYSIRNDIVSTLSSILNIVRLDGIFERLEGGARETVWVELLVQNFIAVTRRGIVSDVGAFVRSMNSTEISSEYKKIFCHNIKDIDQKKINELLNNLNEEIKVSSFSSFEDRHSWRPFFENFMRLMKKVACNITVNGPFPEFHSKYEELNLKRGHIEESPIQEQTEGDNQTIYDKLEPGAMRELVDYLYDQQRNLEQVLYSKDKKLTCKGSSGPLMNKKNESDSSLPNFIAEPPVNNNTMLVRTSGFDLDSFALLKPSNRRPRRHWAERDISELERLLEIHYDNPKRWKKILDEGLKGNFFIGRSNVDLKDKARQMKELKARNGEDCGVWKYAVDR